MNVANNCLVYGLGASSEFNNCVVIGVGAFSTAPNQLVIGNIKRQFSDDELEAYLEANSSLFRTSD